MKTCTKCGETKPVSEFGQYAGKRKGLRSCCKVCHNSANAIWRANKPGYNAAYYKSNRDEILASQTVYREKNSEIIRAYDAARDKANPRRNHKAKEQWRKNNPDKARAASLAWHQANPEMVRIYNHKRRARLREVGGALSKGLAERLIKLQRGKCACCRQPLGTDYHLDHIMPLALGGTNTDDNIQLLCKKCNLQKNAKHPIDFMQKRGFLL